MVSWRIDYLPTSPAVDKWFATTNGFNKTGDQVDGTTMYGFRESLYSKSHEKQRIRAVYCTSDRVYAFHGTVRNAIFWFRERGCGEWAGTEWYK